MSSLYNSVDEIQAVHVEISSACNAGCIDCTRFSYDSDVDEYVHNPFHPNLNYLYPAEKFLSHISQLSTLKNLLYCGNSGDPMAHKDIGYITKEVVKMFPSIASITIHTNGSLGTEETFVKLAQLPVYLDIFFSLDGLSDTLSIYRRNVDFDTVIKNAKIFIEASNEYKNPNDKFSNGGHAFWKWVDFPFIRHQMEEARELSKELGFDDFVVTKPFNDELHDEIVKHSSREIPKFTSYNTKEISLNLPEYNELLISYKKEMESLRKVSDEVQCKAIINPQNRKDIYIDYDGTVWPCCWTGQMRYSVDFSEEWTSENMLKYYWLINYDRKYNEKHGKSWNNLFHNSLKDIIETDWYANDLNDSWNSISENLVLRPCLKKCANQISQRRCGYGETSYE